MAEARDLPMLRWGEELRRRRSARRAGRRRLLLTALCAGLVTAVAATLAWPPRPVLVWNGSASSPVGLYHVSPGEVLRAGDMVVAWAPDSARRLAAERHYLPLNIPLVKQVAAASGDWVCAAGEAVFVNGRHVAHRRSTDVAGRVMPWWTGCSLLGPDDLFLLMPASGSYDGRYFGISRRRDVVGKATLVWRA